MSMSHNRRRAFVPALKASVLAVGLATASVAGATQLEFDNGVTGSFDTTISFGVSVRAEHATSSLIGIANGGTSRSVNEDDADRFYTKGRPFSELLKVTHDLELKQGTWGLFMRGSYFVDFENRNNPALGPVGRDRLGADAKMLDAFISKSFEPAGHNLRLRAGNQVISWGESTFIPNGINVASPLDVSKLRTPGSELKEAFIPVMSLYSSYEISKAASVEAFVQFNHEKFKLDPRGSYFSNNDTASDDGSNVIVTFGRRRDLTNQGPTNPIPPTAGALYTASTPLYGPFDPAASVWAPRSADHNASDYGQYGVAFRYLATALNNTEFGLYFMNYHSRTPVLSGIKGTPTSILTGGPFLTTICGTAALSALCHTGTANYFTEYPEDIRLYGASFNTQGPWGVALQGEYSFRPNQPLQYATTEVILAALGAPNLITGFTQIPGAPAGATAAALVPNGTYLQGWQRVKMSQAQMTATKSVPNIFGADQVIFVGEVGFTKYHGLPTGLKFSGPATYLPATNFAAFLPSVGAFAQQTDGFTTENSWGYRTVLRSEYSNLIFNANVAPRVTWSHDVKGVSQTFNEGVKSYSLGINFDWAKKLSLDMSYTSFFGGRVFCGTDSPVTTQTQLLGQPASYCNNANPLRDRDFYSVVVAYSF
ncbi:MAG: DUF1302 domain-containing protein [Betaproteobacteria bacterium]